MLEILQFIFSSFWTWLGFTIDLAIIFETGLSNITPNHNADINKEKESDTNSKS